MPLSIVTKLAILWILSIIGMVLHFNYHVSEIFYGIEILKPGANGTIPLTAHLTKNIFYHIPILIVLSLLSFNHKAFRLIHLILSALFSIAHLQHLFTELKQNTYDLSQLPLLSIVLLISLMISKTAWTYYKTPNNL